MNTSGKKLDKSLMKSSNRRLVFYMIHGRGPISRVQVAKLINMSTMSVGKIADELITLGLVVEEEISELTPGIGRPPKMLKVASESILCLGVELDRDGLLVGIVNFHGQVIREKALREDFSHKSAEETIRCISLLIKEILSENTDLPVTPAVGIACPGLIDADSGVVIFSSQLKWKNVRLVELLREMSGINKIVIDNEVKARAIAEDLFGAANNSSNTVVLNIGSGIGSSVVINHQIYRGKSNMAGEIGHICINPTGSMCECGRRGCLQTYIADWAILRDASIVKPGATLDDVFEAFKSKEIWVMNIIDVMVRYILVAISILSNTYDPDEIILCGRMIDKYEILQQTILESYNSQLANNLLDSVTIKTSGFGADGNLIGAGTLALYSHLDDIFRQ